MELHYILVFLVIAAIIIAQICIYKNTKQKISAYKSIFPCNASSYSISEEEIQTNDVDDEADNLTDTDVVNVSQIHIDTDNHTLRDIIDSLNMYLKKNKGAASDFYLMKDVVERYCDAQEEEISIQQPIPLYLGLMGTMIGIIVGIGFIAFSGGLSGEFIRNNITSLMTCVAIAMVASLVGIFCTTIISWSSKNATSKVEADKNRFYSWLQTELLPILSGNAINTLYLLQQNLMTFNQTFQSNIEGLGQALSKVEDSSKEQIELISLIKDIDIKKVAQANVAVLKELKDCTGEISVFNNYLHSVSGYLTSVNELNNNLNEHLNRTEAIERMGAFFEKEINQVATREQYINEVVAKVDDTLRKTFEQLAESTKDSITQLRNNSVAEFDALKEHYSVQTEAFEKMLQKQQEKFITTSAETTEMMKEIRNLADIRTSMIQLAEFTNEQTAILKRLEIGISGLNKGNGIGNAEVVPTDDVRVAEKPTESSNIIIGMVAAITVIVFCAFCLYVYSLFFA